MCESALPSTNSHMLGTVVTAYRRFGKVRPFVRPTDNEFEVRFLPPYGDPEVSIPGELGTYLAVGILVNAVAERLDGT